jgi:hypothetical protein
MRMHNDRVLCLIIGILVVCAIAFMQPHIEEQTYKATISTIPTVNETTGNMTAFGVMTVLLSLSFCFIFLFVGLKHPIFFVFGGMVWIVCALTLFVDYGFVFEMIGLGVGVMCLLEGAAKLG